MKSSLGLTLLDKAVEEERKEIENSFLKEWNNGNFIKMRLALYRKFVGIELSTREGIRECLTYDQLEELLGLPYTSSGLYAGVWVTNTYLYDSRFTGYRYVGFAISENKNCYGILWDKDENEIITKL